MDATNEVVDSSGEESSDSDSEREVWRIYDRKEPLDAFLEKNRPSQLSISDATWISVRFRGQDEKKQADEHRLVQDNEGKQQPDEQANEEREDKVNDKEDKRQIVEQEQQTKQRENEPRDRDTEQAKCKEKEDDQLTATRKIPRWLLYMIIMKEWQHLLKNKHIKMVTSETLKELALKHGYTTGKWMVFASSRCVDDLWFPIARAVVAGKLGIATKVSTKNPKENSHVICVYTEDFTDEDDVRRVEKGLRDLGIHAKSYKADIYTILGIYKDNDLGISPSIFKSDDVKFVRGSSKKYEEWNTKEHRVLSYDGKESLDSFLKRNKPSQVNGREAPWISVSYQDYQRHQCRDILLIEAEWKELQKKKGIKLFGAEFLKDLAVKYRYTSGKWMIFTSRYEVDDLWFSVAKAVVAGRLGDEAKVSTKKPNEEHVIYVYTKDFTDKPDVRQVERSLRSLGIRTNMSYKPDIYTSLGISARNDLGISPTIFNSKTYRSGYRY